MPRIRLPQKQSQVLPSSFEESLMPLESSIRFHHDSNPPPHYTHTNTHTHTHTTNILMQDTEMNPSQEKDNDEWDSLDFESSIPSTAVVWHSSTPTTSTSTSTDDKVLKRNMSSSPNHERIKSICINQQDDHTTTPSNNKKKHKSVQFQNDVQFRQKQQRIKKSKSSNRIVSKQNDTTKKRIVSKDLMNPSNSTTKSPSKSRNDILLPHRGIGIDTRYLQSFVGDAISQQYHCLVYEFLDTCAESGLLPSVLSCTSDSSTSDSSTSDSSTSDSSTSDSSTSDSSTTSNVNLPASSTRTNIQCKGTTLNVEIWSKQNMTHGIITPVSIHSCEDIQKTNTNTSFACPMELKATESWVRLDALVHSILMESSKRSNAFPMDITIMTNDAAFFVDTNIDAHKNGVSHFWNHMRSKFNTNKVKSIQIVCFCTGVDVLSFGVHDPFDPSILSTSFTTDDGATATVAATSLSYSSSTESLEKPMITSLEEEGSSSCSRDSTTTSLSPSGETLGVSHRFNIHVCAKAIINELASLSIKESDGSYHDTNDSKNPMDITFSFHDCHKIYFENLLRNWTRETFCMTCPKGRISFDLPETLDGTQCTVTLELSYQMLPFQVNSLAAVALVEDMKVISNSTFSVIQLVPLDKVDISLIYGVPLVAKAGLEGDIDQYKEIQRLYNELLKYLLTKDCGLVLCSETSVTMGAFKNSPVKSLYLLMAQEQEFDLERSRDVLLKGTLHRYCRKSSQILEPVSMTNSAVSYDDTNVDVYSEVVKNALEFIPTAVINPSSLGSTETV